MQQGHTYMPRVMGGKKERRGYMNNKFIRVDEVAQELSVSKPYAYKLIKKLNDELKEQGFITIAGRVNRQYFQERFYGSGENQGKGVE